MKIRPMAVKDGFYPWNPIVLKNMLEEFFAIVKLDIGSRPESAVAPHAGYVYSGLVAAYTYKAIFQYLESLPSTIVILVPSHYAIFEGVSVGIFNHLETPFGRLSGAVELGKRLIKGYPGLFTSYLEPQLPEHAIETQLPFLKYIFDEKGIEKQILPLVFGQVDVVKVGEVLSQLDDVFFIVSSDLSHYLPYDEAIQRDKITLEAFLSQDITKIVEVADACGKWPWVSLTVISLLKKWEPTLLKYLNSGDTAGDKSRVVGYSSVIYV